MGSRDQQSFSIDRTDDAPPFPAAQEALLARVAEVVAAAHPGPRPCLLVLTGAAFMQGLNARYRGTDAVTDVLSFDLGGAEGVGAKAGGEVYVCLERAAAQAADQQVSLLAEVARLLVHGMLHLAGYEHHTPAALGEMETETDRLLGAAGLAEPGTAR